MSDTFRFLDYDIPLDLLRLTGGGPETFEQISAEHIKLLQANIGLEPDSTVLEIGCGIGRDAIPLTRLLSPRGGRYVGIDIIGRSIEWCNLNIAARHENFSFIHYDVADQLHNPNGHTHTSDIRLPLPDSSVDKIILWSVFTHMFENDIVHYLREFARVIRPTGKIWLTLFIVDDDTLASARATNLTEFNLRFDHPYAPGCFINVPEFPAGAVAYTAGTVFRMIAKGGLEMAAAPLFGSWSGLPPIGTDPGQDALVLCSKSSQSVEKSPPSSASSRILRLMAKNEELQNELHALRQQ